MWCHGSLNTKNDVYTKPGQLQSIRSDTSDAVNDMVGANSLMRASELA